MSNRLKHEQSPYLLQHRDNPVDWYPWGEEAFRKAVEEDKPIFLSIGYATCHWCHVMEHESFEDPEVARLMNEAFVSIKVDREERPDIDGVYMTVCQMTTGHGGWPLTILMTPDRKPFFAGTYFPRQSRFGRIGMLELVPQVAVLWATQRARVLASAEQLTGTLLDAAKTAAGPAPGADVLDRAFEQLSARFDPEYGGFGSAPKFPSPHTLLFLLRYGRRSGTARAWEMAAHTLSRMRLGGIFDHVGYGFHRYATDREWRLPHFEKMLYDQAMLALAYVEAYQATRDPAFARTAREIFTYVLRDMTALEGGFYSAEDADSEGREGKFYVWTLAELREVLGASDAAFVESVYPLADAGNFADEATRQQTGENILFLDRPLAVLAQGMGLTEADLDARLDAIRQRLFAHRERRVHPLKDDKILTDWNGLMIAALARAARVLDEPAYAEAAGRAVAFVERSLTGPDGRLLHRYRNGDASIAGHVDDYAFFAWGLLELYETTFEPTLLVRARALNDALLRHFWDDEAGGFFFTADDAEPLIVRQKEFYDGALPSGNAVAMANLLRLGRITGDPALEARAMQVARAAGETAGRMPSGFTALLLALDFGLGPTSEIVVAGEPSDPETQAMLRVIRSAYLPNSVVLLRPAADEDAAALVGVAAFVEAQRPVGGRPTVYLCQHYACDAPITDVQVLADRLG